MGNQSCSHAVNHLFYVTTPQVTYVVYYAYSWMVGTYAYYWTNICLRAPYYLFNSDR